jgi:hypothetical protein
MDENTKKLLTACQNIAKDEGIEDDEALASRINEIYQDAVLNEPVTEIGKLAKINAESIELAEAAVKFDYDKYMDDMTVPAVIQSLQVISQYADGLALGAKWKKLSDEDEKIKMAAFNSAVLAIFDIMNKNNIGIAAYKDTFAGMKDIISYAEAMANVQIDGHRDQLLATIYGSKNPGTSELDARYATYADMLEARQKYVVEFQDKE